MWLVFLGGVILFWLRSAGYVINIKWETAMLLFFVHPWVFSVTKRINEHNKKALAKPQADLDQAIDQVKQCQNTIDTGNVEITNARR